MFWFASQIPINNIFSSFLSIFIKLFIHKHYLHNACAQTIIMTNYLTIIYCAVWRQGLTVCKILWPFEYLVHESELHAGLSRSARIASSSSAAQPGRSAGSSVAQSSGPLHNNLLPVRQQTCVNTVLRVNHVYLYMRVRHKPWRSYESWPGPFRSCWLKHHLWGFSSEHAHKPQWLSWAEDKHITW